MCNDQAESYPNISEGCALMTNVVSCYHLVGSNRPPTSSSSSSEQVDVVWMNSTVLFRSCLLSSFLDDVDRPSPLCLDIWDIPVPVADGTAESEGGE